jgi:hypothetical protein
MSARAPTLGDPASLPAPTGDLQPPERSEDELIMHLEPDQFVVETSRPLPRAALGRRAAVALWGLRAFVVLVAVMVVYTFIYHLN